MGVSAVLNLTAASLRHTSSNARSPGSTSPPRAKPSATEGIIMSEHWLADRTRSFDASGIRKVFDLAAKLPDPINLSIGQPDFDVPEPVRQAAIEAIQSRKNGYALTPGHARAARKTAARVRQRVRPRRPRVVRHLAAPAAA